MPLIPIDLPPGMMRNGPPYAARGRWVDGNLVRWHNSALRPIGGWQQRKTADGAIVQLPVNEGEVYRDSISYTTISGEKESLFFSNNRVMRLNSSDILTDVTPDSYYQGESQPSVPTGYGTGPYGREVYGRRRTAVNRPDVSVTRVNSDMWGENVLFAVAGTGPIYEYVPGTAKAVELEGAPNTVEDIIVTDQRIVMVIKNFPEVRQLQWSDRENNTEWTPTISNYAGDRLIQGTGKLVGMYKVQSQILILSETDAHVARYISAPFVYGVDRVGTNCAPLYRTAVVKDARFAIWMGDRNFWLYDGTLKPVPCEVSDTLFEDLDLDQISKVFSTTNAKFSEVWWFYQSQGGSAEDINSYVNFDYVNNHWSTGKLSRTTGFDTATYDNPIMVGRGGEVYNHEQYGVLVDGTAYALTGPLELEGGNRNMAVRYVFPDTELPNEVVMDFYTRQMPTDPDTYHGPFPYQNPVSTTGVLGREVRMEVTGLTSTWEVGTMRFDVQVAGGGFR